MDSYDYDIIIVGSGLYGAVTAWRAKEKGLRCLVLERRSDVGGNVREKMTEGINVHLYGAHIFHTDNEQVWSFVRRFSDFNSYVHTVIARNADRYYHMPVSLMTFLRYSVQCVLTTYHAYWQQNVRRNIIPVLKILNRKQSTL